MGLGTRMTVWLHFYQQSSFLFPESSLGNVKHCLALYSTVIFSELLGNSAWRCSKVVSNKKVITYSIYNRNQPCIKSIFHYKQLPLTLESLFEVTGFSVSFQWLMFKMALDLSTALNFGFQFTDDHCYYNPIFLWLRGISHFQKCFI